MPAVAQGGHVMAHAVRIAAALLVLAACRGEHEGPGTITPARVPADDLAARRAVQTAVRERLGVSAEAPKQILFGDLHVHTTFSADAFVRSLPMLQGEGAHPPADACDFARFCSALDFWSINDHAEAISPQHWRETKDSIRQCNALAGDPMNPDITAFLGWEWTQVGVTPETHYGHKNVIFRETADDRVPTRPISALDRNLVGALRQRPPLWQRIQFPLLDWSNRQRYLDFGVFQQELIDTRICPEGVDTRQLPENCSETAHTPQALFEKLAQWGFDTIVIPHGNTWGFYTPPGSSWDKQLTAAQHDPDRQTLIEVFSGHGNSEEYRGFQDVAYDAQGALLCPEPTATYLPCCWQAGEIVRARCGDTPAEECTRRVAEARRNYLRAGAAGRATMPWATPADWRNCGQCTDCFLPAFNFRPKGSAQYALALSNFDDPAAPRRFRFGFIASSDNHSARPGTGYKEFARHAMTEAAGARDEAWRLRLIGGPKVPEGQSMPFDPANPPAGTQNFQVLDFERQASFFLTGGLVAVHSAGRDRDAIWSALKRREVYGTSGERILLWFDLLNAPGGPAPMGAEVQLGEAPRFRVRAVGSFQQQPGCPDWARDALGDERLARLCRGECYHPSGERRRIARVDIIRIRPQVRAGEPVGQLVEDPWRRFECPAGATGCVVEVGDPEFVAGGRETIYYARAVQEPTPAVNADNLRCRFDESGRCVDVQPCWGDYRTPFDDDCLAPNEERAWSSPIYVRR
jgi:Protein of unknown function (DUF3604)